jgi:hypothetical protein
MADDPTEGDLARKHKRQQLDRVDQVPSDDNARRHPSWGGSRGYDMFYRQEQVEAGHPVPSRIVRSIQRWIRDGIGPLRQTGNKGSYELLGEHLLLLVLFKLIWPHAINIECSVFIANNPLMLSFLHSRKSHVPFLILGIPEKLHQPLLTKPLLNGT